MHQSNPHNHNRTQPVTVTSSLTYNLHAFMQTHVPYRDSVLTFLLKESLGGNSKVRNMHSLIFGACMESIGTRKDLCLYNSYLVAAQFTFQ